MGQILSHSKMGHINAASKIISMNSPENQVLRSTGLTLAWVPLLQVKETYLCSGVALKDLFKKKIKPKNHLVVSYRSHLMLLCSPLGRAEITGKIRAVYY